MAGTVGCFVTSGSSAALYLLSNNHVLADENRYPKGGSIVQPGTLAGQRSDLQVGDVVHKVGRTTGVRHGRVTAFELDGVAVEYDLGVISFDDQIEIEGAGHRALSDAGDSGSLIVDDQLRAAALLFAGGDHGGSNGPGLTYANPIGAVLQALKVKLA
jgi:hypothetical protein